MLPGLEPRPKIGVSTSNAAAKLAAAIGGQVGTTPRQQELEGPTGPGRAGRFPGPAQQDAHRHVRAGFAGEGRRGQSRRLSQIRPHVDVQRQRKGPLRARHIRVWSPIQ